jgi:hypothetical protein
MNTRERRSPAVGAAWVCLLPLMGVAPLADLSQKTVARTWALSGFAALLGGLLAAWVLVRLRRAKSALGRRYGLSVAVAGGMLAAALLGGAPAGVQMIYFAAWEGFLSAITLLAARATLLSRGADRRG